ncbi:MAG: transglycosylase SLT domain-containing protein [Pseudomonadota bacterium]
MAFVRVIALSALIGATAFAKSVAAPADETALAADTPAALEITDPAELLTLLSKADAALYREAFALQEKGSWKAADAKIAGIENEILFGYLQYQRYMHPTKYRSKFSELKTWLAYYADHPEADKIYRLARKRRPSGGASPLRPIKRQWRASAEQELHPDIAADYKKTSRPRLNQIEGRVRYLAGRNQAMTASREIERHLKRRVITQRQFDRMRSWIAASLYFQGYVDTARPIAESVAKRSGETAVLSYWIGGLIAFRDGDIERAHQHFSRMVENPYQDDDLRSGAGFWSARTALAAGQPDDLTKGLEIAAQYPFTFYGQLALAQLGRDYDYNWSAPALEKDQLDALVTVEPRVARAIALWQVGHTQEASTELRWASGAIPEDLDRDLLAVATALDLPAAQIDVALTGDSKALASGLYPIPDYAPRDGFKVDRALIFALMRQESKFKTDATSRVGARGLMQLMPATASYVAGDRSLRYKRGRDRLYDPAFNLSLGQRYVQKLIDTAADGDLFHLAAAYNGGPGNLRRWKRDVAIDDPLLFIESIPSSESREFVEKVLTNFWIYRDRLGQSAPSRDKVAAGELPLYEALDQIAAR